MENTELKTAINTAKEAIKLAHESELNSINEKLSANDNAFLNVYAELKSLKEIPKVTAPVATDLKSALTASFEAKADEIKSIVNNGGNQTRQLTFEIKAPVDITTANTIGGVGSNPYLLTQDTGIISTIRKRSEVYLANVSVGNIGTSTAHWVEEIDEQGNPIFIAEGATKPQASVRYVAKSAPCKKIAVYGKVTTEMMADLPQLVSYVQNNIMKRLDLKTESELLSGDGIADNISGLKTFATPFVAGGLATMITLANEFDVLVAIANQVDIAFGDVNKSVYVHPTTWAKMLTLKTTTGEPLYKNYYDVVNMTYGGVKVIASTMVTLDEFVGGDLSVVRVLFREQMNITIGLDGNDFTNNKKTLLAEKRLVQFVSANDTQVLVKGTFTTAKAALLKP
jgi:HK97 family phage major capsid protein